MTKSDRSKQTPLEVLILFWWCFQCFDTVLIDFFKADSANLRVWTPGAVGPAWFWAWFGAWFWAWLPMKNTRLEVLILFWLCFQCFDTVLIDFLQACSANLRFWTPGAVRPAGPPVPFVPPGPCHSL